MYLDVKGLITQRDGDGGDKLQREGFWFEGEEYLAGWHGEYNPDFISPPGMADYGTALKTLTDPATGNLQRDEIKYTEALDPKDVSRDQAVSNIRACGLYGGEFDEYTKRFLTNVIKNFSRFPNGDIAFLQDYARFARSLSWGFWSLPLIWLGDIEMIFSSIIWILVGFDSKEFGEINHIGDLAFTQRVRPTIFSWIARKLYKHLRPFGVPYVIESYFAASTNANTEFIDLWLPTVEKF